MNRYLFTGLIDERGEKKEVEVCAWTPLDAVLVLKAMCKDLRPSSDSVEVYASHENVSLN